MHRATEVLIVWLLTALATTLAGCATVADPTEESALTDSAITGQGEGPASQASVREVGGPNVGGEVAVVALEALDAIRETRSGDDLLRHGGLGGAQCDSRATDRQSLRQIA